MKNKILKFSYIALFILSGVLLIAPILLRGICWESRVCLSMLHTTAPSMALLLIAYFLYRKYINNTTELFEPSVEVFFRNISVIGSILTISLIHPFLIQFSDNFRIYKSVPDLGTLIFIAVLFLPLITFLVYLMFPKFNLKVGNTLLYFLIGFNSIFWLGALVLVFFIKSAGSGGSF